MAAPVRQQEVLLLSPKKKVSFIFKNKTDCKTNAFKKSLDYSLKACPTIYVIKMFVG